MADAFPIADRRSILSWAGMAAVGYLASPIDRTLALAGNGLGTQGFERTGNFDLDDPTERLLARIKVVTSLTGERTYIHSVSRFMLAPPNKPSYQIYAELDLRTVWIEPSGDVGEAPRTQALFTKIPIDPLSFEPITRYYNPYLGRHVAVEPTLFGGSGLLVDLESDAPNAIYQQDKPHYRMGKDIVFVTFDPRDAEGPFQPHTDSAVMRANFVDLMDPSRGWVEADYSIAAIRKASVYPWSGVTGEDQAQVLSLKLGRKVGRIEDLPPEFQRSVVQQFPDRV